MTLRPSDTELAQMDPQDAYALGVDRGLAVATARAVSRQQHRLSIDGEPVPHEGCVDTEGASSP